MTRCWVVVAVWRSLAAVSSQPCVSLSRGPVASTHKLCNEFISCLLWKCPSLSCRHSNRAEAHKHQAQCVNPHSLASPRPPSMAFEHLFMKSVKGEARSPPTPVEDSVARPRPSPLIKDHLCYYRLTSVTYTCVFEECMSFHVESRPEKRRSNS